MASKYLQKYQVPEGFYDILHEFSREILRAQPEDILDYAANYFEHKCQGKEYYYESKSNIQRTGDEAKKYAPTPAANFTGQAQKVVATSNTNETVTPAVGVGSNVNRQPSSNSVKPSNSNKRIPSGDASSRPRTQNSIKSDLSHPDEKKITKEFVGDLYSSALNKAQQSNSADRSDEEGKANPSPINRSNEGSGQGSRTRVSNQAIETQNSNKLSAQEIPTETPGAPEEGDNEVGQQEQQEFQGERQEEQEGNQDQQLVENAENGDAQEEGQQEVEENAENGDVQEEGQQEIEGQENQETAQGEEQPNNNEEQGEGAPSKERVEEKVVLDGPVEEYENVAVKIQSVFRGSQARKATKKL